MNAKKAKKLRRQVYGDNSIRKRGYGKNQKNGSTISDPVRRVYQKLKGSLKGVSI